MEKIFVTKTFLPDKERYLEYVDQIWKNVQLTNNGPLLQQLERDIAAYLPTKNMMVCTNGTIVLQMAIKALQLTGEIITTPFSYVATTNAIIWEKCTPVFADIHPDTLCIDPESIEKRITPNTQAIMATHVYGYPCDVEAIEAIAKKHQLKVIYDAAHCFGVKLKGKSLLSYGDVSTCSFHATKIFHSVEGGCIVCEDETLFDALYKLRQFGHIVDDYYSAGINAKNSEFHAAMGLAILPSVDNIIKERKRLSELYDSVMPDVKRPIVPQQDFEYNYGYYAVVWESEEQLLKIKSALEAENIFPRRYFFPSLNTLPFLKDYYPCPVSEDISRRAMCLPLYIGLQDEKVIQIAEIIRRTLNAG